MASQVPGALGARLLEAWEGGPLLDPSDESWQGLDHASALAVGREVLDRLGAGSSACWKLGATDAATQARLGVPGPISAPVVPTRVQHGVGECTVDRAQFRQPRLEAEIGLVAVEGGWVAVPAVEIADCRVDGWQLPPWAVLADSCLQGAMIFGTAAPTAGAPGDVVEVLVRRDGQEVARGTGRISDARARLEVLPPEAAPASVATGSLTPLMDAQPGRWDFDFGAFGRLLVDVV